MISEIVPDAVTGCHMLLASSMEAQLPEWAGAVATIEEFFGDEDEIDLDELPDFSIDPETKCLHVINTSDHPRVVTVSLQGCQCLSMDESSVLEQGIFMKPGHPKRFPVTTFIVLTPGQTVAEVCVIKPKKEIRDVKVDSHIGDAFSHQSIDSFYDITTFPLSGASGTFLCTQASGGGFTHFQHPSTFHAVDFRCPVGTPVVAVADGVICSIKADCTVTGVHVSNLFDWNSVVLKTDSGHVVEYVHIHHEGVAVSVGERVVRGQQLCLSGEAGFCPEPHLHFEVHLDESPQSPSVPVKFSGNFFSPGSSYP